MCDRRWIIWLFVKTNQGRNRRRKQPSIQDLHRQDLPDACGFKPALASGRPPLPDVPLALSLKPGRSDRHGFDAKFALNGAAERFADDFDRDAIVDLLEETFHDHVHGFLS